MYLTHLWYALIKWSPTGATTQRSRQRPSLTFGLKSLTLARRQRRAWSLGLKQMCPVRGPDLICCSRPVATYIYNLGLA